MDIRMFLLRWLAELPILQSVNPEQPRKVNIALTSILSEMYIIGEVNVKKECMKV